MNEETKKRLSKTMKEFYKTEEGIAHKEKMKVNMTKYWEKIKKALDESQSRDKKRLPKAVSRI